MDLPSQKPVELPANVQSFFDSDTPRLELERSCFLYGITQGEIAKISGPIGQIFLKELKLSDLPNAISAKVHLSVGAAFGVAFEITKRIFNRYPDYFTDAFPLMEQWAKMKSAPAISEEAAYKKVLEIEPWILDELKQKDSSDDMRKQAVNSIKMRLENALKQYPQLGEQTLTSSPIKIKAFPEKVRPTIKNWLSDYTASLGYDYHDSMARNNYIFKNINYRGLTPADRHKVFHIISAFDEKNPIDINVDTKQVIFPDFSPVASKNIVSSMMPRTAPPAPAANVLPRAVPTPRPAQPEIRRATPPETPMNRKIRTFFQTPSTIKREAAPDPSPSPVHAQNSANSFGLSSNQTMNIRDDRTRYSAQTASPDMARNPQRENQDGESHLESLFKSNIFKQQGQSEKSDIPLPRPEIKSMPPKLSINYSPVMKENPSSQTVIRTAPAPANVPFRPSQPQNINSVNIQEKKTTPGPYRISPVFGSEENEDEDQYLRQPLPKNVVDLRE